MATVKIIYRASLAGNYPGSLYFRIIHKRKIRQVHTGHHIYGHEWDDVQEKINLQGDASRVDYLNRVEKSLRHNRSRLSQIIKSLEKKTAGYGVNDIVERYSSPIAVTGLISYCQAEIARCREVGRISAADHYQSTLNSFMRFYGEGELPLGDIDSSLISRYECFMKNEGLCLNTISYYMRKLRGLYNQAVEDGLTDDRQPFKHVYTGVATTVKRAVSLDAIKSLIALNLVGRPLDAFARDVFLFSFYMCGMAPVDIAYLQKKDLQNGFVCYRRRKTSQLLKIKWTAEMNAIVLRYGDADSDYMLPLIKSPEKTDRRQYLSATHLINKHLKKLGKEIGLTEPLTLYVARHTWASVALSNNVPIGVISQGMGHDSEKTTRIYLASLDTSTLDKANEGIIGLLNM